MAITPLGTPPSRQDPANFSDRADAFMAQLPTFATEANALAADVNSKQVTASSAATTATTKAGEASISATNAANSASSASTSATSASTSATAASDWAIKTSGPVTGSEYSAKYWGQIAQGFVVGTLIDDSNTSAVKVWSGSKVNNFAAKKDGGNTFVNAQNIFSYSQSNPSLASNYAVKTTGAYGGGYLIHDVNECISLYSVGGSLNLGFGNPTSITSKYTFNAVGDFTATGKVTATGVATSNSVDILNGFSSSCNLAISGYNSVQFVSNTGGYGIYSDTGGFLVVYERATGKYYFAGIDSANIVQNNGTSYNIKAAGLTDSPGTAPHFACRAWVNFNSSNSTINSQGNVSSITDMGTGMCRLNFATALPDNLYAVSGSGNAVATLGTYPCVKSQNTSYVDITWYSYDTIREPTLTSIAIFR